MILVVAEPTSKSIIAARRMARYLLDTRHQATMVAVANKVRDRADVDLIERGLDLEVIASVPWDDEFAAAERRGAAPIESAPGCAAVGAVESLCNRLMNGSST